MLILIYLLSAIVATGGIVQHGDTAEKFIDQTYIDIKWIYAFAVLMPMVNTLFALACIHGWLKDNI